MEELLREVLGRRERKSFDHILMGVWAFWSLKFDNFDKFDNF